MTDHQILFSAPMVRALLAGTKTQTRRILAPGNTLLDGRRWSKLHKAQSWDWTSAWLDSGPSPAGNPGPYLHLPWLGGDADIFEGTVHRVYPLHQPGDRLIVREAWRVTKALDDIAPRDLDRTTIPEWIATDPALYEGRIRASMHLPHWASRLTLVVSEVRIERLQDISEADAIAEGICGADLGSCREGLEEPEAWQDRPEEGPVYFPSDEEEDHIYLDPRHAYLALWDRLNDDPPRRDFGSRRNPWVIATSFAVHHCNVDDMEGS